MEKQVRRSLAGIARAGLARWNGWRAPVRMPMWGRERSPCESVFNTWTSYPRIWLPLTWLEFNWNFRECDHSSFCYVFQHTLPRMPSLFLLLIWYLLSSKAQAWPHFLQLPALWHPLSLWMPIAPTPTSYLHSSHMVFGYWLPSYRSIWHISLTRC